VSTRILLYEWCCSGGAGTGEAAIAAEGRMMLEALAVDAAKAAQLDVTVLVDPAGTLDLPPQARQVAVRPGDHLGQLLAAAPKMDWMLIVAPESDGILGRLVREVRAAGGRVLGPADSVIAMASDKQTTIDTLAGRGLPVPAGRGLSPGEGLPSGFRLPAVRKARGGCGCEEVALIRSPDCPPAAVATRLEAFAPGTPAGVSLLCGPRGILSLPVMRQRFSDSDQPRYLGSEPLPDEEACSRAMALARRAAAAMSAAAGWIGVDVILGARPDGRDDRVLEVNPRISTSIVGQTRLFASSLVLAMSEAAAGDLPRLVPADDAEAARGSFRLPSG